MANKLNITKGEYIPRKADEESWACITLDSNTVLTSYATHAFDIVNSERDKEASDIVLLSADALNTYQLCSLQPSELLQQRNELIEIIKDFKNKVETGKSKSVKTYEKINVFLSKIEDEEMHPLEIMLYKKFTKGDRFLCFGSGNVMTFEKLYYINKMDGRVFVFAKNDKGEFNNLAIRNNNGQWAEKYTG